MPVGELRAKFNARLGDIKRGAITRLFVAIVQDTPVLSGRLRANWNLIRGSKGDVALRTVPVGTGAQTGEAYADPSYQIERDVQTLVDEKDGTYTLINPMPYAYRVEYEGWSSKAPNGMVRINLAKFGLYLKDASLPSRGAKGRFLSNAVNAVEGEATAVEEGLSGAAEELGGLL